MKKWILKSANILASLALVISVFNFSTCCALIIYQPEMPEGAEDLCKF